MNSHDWFTLAVRILGLYLLISSLEEFIPYLLYLMSDMGSQMGTSFMIGIFIWFIGRTALSLVLVLFAPALASRFYVRSTPENTSSRIDEEKALAIGLKLLAFYALLLALQTGATAIIGIVAGKEFVFERSNTLIDSDIAYTNGLISCGLNLAFALGLFKWNDQIIALLNKANEVSVLDEQRPQSPSELD